MNSVTKHVKVALLTLITLYIPNDTSPVNVTWARQFISKLIHYLDLNDNYIDGMLPILENNQSATLESIDEKFMSRQITILPLLEIIDLEIHRNTYLFIELMAFIITNQFYDAYGRSLLQNLSNVVRITRSDRIALEYHMSSLFLSMIEQSNLPSEPTQNSRANSVSLQSMQQEFTPKTNYYRYAQIGVVSLAAGAIVAVTGGLAAPAVAAALLGLGAATSVAAAITSTTAAAVFGSAGAGLAGYKMSRRTQQVNEFEIEAHSVEPYYRPNLAQILMVSGCINEDDDFRRVFGVMPSELTFRERLIRYYKHIDNISRLEQVDEEVAKYSSNPSELLNLLLNQYQIDPSEPMNLGCTFRPPTMKNTHNIYTQYVLKIVILRNELLSKSKNSDGIDEVSSKLNNSTLTTLSSSSEKASANCSYQVGDTNAVQQNSDTEKNIVQLQMELKQFMDQLRKEHDDMKSSGAITDDEDTFGYIRDKVNITGNADNFKPHEDLSMMKNPQNKNDRDSDDDSDVGDPSATTAAGNYTSTIGGDINRNITPIDIYTYEFGSECSSTGSRSRPISESFRGEIEQSTQVERSRSRLGSWHLETSGMDIPCISLPNNVLFRTELATTSQSHLQLQEKFQEQAQPLQRIPSGQYTSLASIVRHDNQDCEVIDSPGATETPLTRASHSNSNDNDFDYKSQSLPELESSDKPTTSNGLIPVWDWNELDISNSYDLYLLKWELKLQKELGRNITALIEDIQTQVVQEVLTSFFIPALAAAVAVPAILLKATDLIDTSWTVAINRADLAGKELARALLARYYSGDIRPVTLVGYSTGARVIFSCLKHLAILRNRYPSEAKKTLKSRISERYESGKRAVNSVVQNVFRGSIARVNSCKLVDERIPTRNGRLSTSSFNGIDYDTDTPRSIDDFIEEATSPSPYKQTAKGTTAPSRPSNLFSNLFLGISSSVKTSTTVSSADLNLHHSSNRNRPSSLYYSDSDVDSDENCENDYKTSDATTDIKEKCRGGEENKLNSSATEQGQSTSEAPTRQDTHDILLVIPDDELRLYIDRIIQDVVLLGAPVSTTSRHWLPIRKLVKGRLINGYSKKDFILNIIYRAHRGTIRIAGVMDVPDSMVENMDLSHVVSEHRDYCTKMKQILQIIDLMSVQ